MLTIAPEIAAGAETLDSAQPEDKSKAMETTASRATDAAKVAAALQHAQELFRRGAYEEALHSIRQPCRTTSIPECTYSIAVLQHALGQCELALNGYRTYLESDPYSRYAKSARAAAAELAKECGADREAEPPHSPQRTYGEISLEKQTVSLRLPQQTQQEGGAWGALPHTRASAAPSTTVIALIAASAGAGVVSGAGGLLMARTARDVNRARVFDAEAQHQMYVNYPRYRNITWGFGGASLVLLAAGISLWITGDDQHELSLEGQQLRYRAVF